MTHDCGMVEFVMEEQEEHCEWIYLGCHANFYQCKHIHSANYKNHQFTWTSLHPHKTFTEWL